VGETLSGAVTRRGVEIDVHDPVIGLGGDFYDVIVSDGGRVFAVIGDIPHKGPAPSPS
jgi:serine phosphatase RsbU (regulator of sigma subunit)